MANGVRYTAAKKREIAAARAAELAAWRLEVATSWSAEQYAEHVRKTIVVNRDDTVEVWIDGDPANGSHVVPVLAHAADVIARMRAELGLA